MSNGENNRHLAALWILFATRQGGTASTGTASSERNRLKRWTTTRTMVPNSQHALRLRSTNHARGELDGSSATVVYLRHRSIDLTTVEQKSHDIGGKSIRGGESWRRKQFAARGTTWLESGRVSREHRKGEYASVERVGGPRRGLQPRARGTTEHGG